MNMPNLRALIDQANQTVRKAGWHIWQSRDGSDPGRFYATRDRSSAEMAEMVALYGGVAGSGETLDALTLDGIVAKIQGHAA